MYLVIQRSYLTEINLTAINVGQRYYFLDVPELRQGTAFIQGIECFTAAQLATSPNNKTTIAAAGAASIMCTFTVGETEDVFNIPYYTLVSANNAGLIRAFNNKSVNLVKSYVTVVNSSNLNASESVLFNWYFKKV